MRRALPATALVGMVVLSGCAASTPASIDAAFGADAPDKLNCAFLGGFDNNDGTRRGDYRCPKDKPSTEQYILSVYDKEKSAQDDLPGLISAGQRSGEVGCWIVYGRNWMVSGGASTSAEDVRTKVGGTIVSCSANTSSPTATS